MYLCEVCDDIYRECVKENAALVRAAKAILNVICIEKMAPEWIETTLFAIKSLDEALEPFRPMEFPDPPPWIPASASDQMPDTPASASDPSHPARL